MEQLITWVTAHPFQTFASYVAFMLAVQSLPKPDANSTKFYLWAYAFLHLMSVNVSLVAKVLKIGGPTAMPSSSSPDQPDSVDK